MNFIVFVDIFVLLINILVATLKHLMFTAHDKFCFKTINFVIGRWQPCWKVSTTTNFKISIKNQSFYK